MSRRCLGIVLLAVGLSAGTPALAQDAGNEPDAGQAQAPSTQDPVVPPPIAGKVELTQHFAVESTPPPPEGSKTHEATVGTHLVLSLSVTHPAQTTVALPEQQPTGRFELLGVDRVPAIAAPGAESVTETLRLTYAIYRPGRHRLDSFELKVLDAEGRISAVRTEPVEVTIRSVIANESDPQMQPPRPPVPIRIEDWMLVWVLGTTAGLLLATAIGALLYRRFAPKPVPPPPPPRPAYDVAIEKLSAIRAANLVADGLYEEFYVRVSEAVREYLGRRYNLSLTDKHGLELTTWELMEHLREVTWPRGLTVHDVEVLLVDCDMVKFARYAPTVEESNELLDRAFRTVELTRPLQLGPEVLASETPPPPQEARS